MAQGTYVFEVDWDDNGSFTDTGEDVTARTLSLRFARGRDNSSSLSARSVAGRLFATLDNDSGDYSPFNSASPLFGNLLPRRRCRVRITAPVAGTLWTGWIKAILPTSRAGPEKRVTLEASGALGFAGDHEVTISMQTSIRTDEALDAILDSVGWKASVVITSSSVANPSNILTAAAHGLATGEEVNISGHSGSTPDINGTHVATVVDGTNFTIPVNVTVGGTGGRIGDRNLSTGLTTMTRWWTDQRALSAMREVETTEGGFIKEDKDGSIAFEGRHFRLTDAKSTTSQKTFSDNPPATLPFLTITEEDPLPFIFNDFRADVTIYTVGAEAVLWTLAATGADSPKVEPGVTAVFVASYPVPDSPTDDIAVDAWSALVENTDYEANSQAGGGGDDKSGSLTVSVTKYSTTQLISITNNDSAAVFLTLLQAKGTPVSASDPVKRVASDATSQAAYEKRTWPSPTPFLPDVDEALEWCNSQLSLFKDPLALVAITYFASQDTNAFTAMNDLDLSHRITLDADGNAGLGINGAFLIEAERHVIDSAFNHQVTYLLSPIESYAGFWTLDVSKLDTETKLQY